MNRQKKVYASFDELLNQNKVVFKLISQNKERHIFRAIWDSRQTEIDLLKERLDNKTVSYEKKISELNTYIGEYRFKTECRDKKLLKLNRTINNLETRLDSMIANSNFYIREIEALRELKAYLESELNKAQEYGELMERAFNMAQSQLDKSDKDKSILKDNLDMAHLTILKLDEDRDKIKRELMEEKQMHEETNRELEKSKSYARSYKQLNNKMSNELFKVNSELEKIQGFGF